VKELLLPFGSLKAFNLVMDKNTGNSKVLLRTSSLHAVLFPCPWMLLMCSAFFLGVLI
jgi:hypothetical protein